MESAPVYNPGVPTSSEHKILVATPSAGVIPGLEALIPLNQIFVKQQVDILEVVVGYEQANRYTFFAPSGQMVYLGDEDSNCCVRQYCGSARGFTLNIRDPNGNGILLDRPLMCILTSMDVFAIFTGELLGSIQQQCTCCTGARFDVRDALGNVVFVIKAPYCTASCCGNVVFELVTPMDQEVTIGQITKTWAGFGQEVFTNADNFGISFPGDLSVKMKAVLLGACILIDFMFYEDKQNNDRNRY